jgi:hypothetical protein
MKFYDSTDTVKVEINDNANGFIIIGDATNYTRLRSSWIDVRNQTDDSSYTTIKGYISNPDNATNYAAYLQAGNASSNSYAAYCEATGLGSGTQSAYGVRAKAQSGTVNNYGVYSEAVYYVGGATATYYGGRFIGTGTSGSTVYGVHAKASGGTTNKSIYSDGNVQLDNLPSYSSEPNVIWADTSGNLYLGAAPSGGGGTVTSVAAGDGMDFTTITATGSVTMGTPSTCTASTTNAITSTSHTHEITGFAEGTGTANYLAVWNGTNEITGTSAFQVNSPSGGWARINASGVRIDSLNGTGIRIVTANADGDLGDGNLSGHVTTNGSLATTLTIAAITGQTELTSAIAATDELLINDGGVIKRVDITFLEAYMNSNLSFGSSDVSVANQSNDRVITATATTDALNGEQYMTFNGSELKIGGGISTSKLIFANTGTYDWSITATGDTTLIITHYGGDHITCTSGVSTKIHQAIIMPDMANVDQGNLVEYNTTSGAVTWYVQSSDIRLKENVVRIVDPMKDIMTLTGNLFNFNKIAIAEMGSKPHRQAGMIAQEVMAVFPEICHKINDTDYMTVKYDQMVPFLLEGLKETYSEVDRLKHEVKILKDSVQSLMEK